EPVRIEVVTREGVVASLPQVAREQGGEGLWRVTLEAANGFALNRSYFLFGGAAPMVATLGQSGVTLMVTPEFEQQKSVLMRETLAVLAHYAEWMPAKLPPQMSVFVFYAPHDADHVEGFARPGGIVLQFGRAGMGHAQRRRVLVAHELFHLFNGEQLHFSKADYESAAWFREGLTQYMAILALRELGLLSPRQFLDIVSVAASTLLTQPDAHRTAESRSTMPYHRGFFLSWAIDSQWQSAKTGRSWAGFWRALSAQSWSEAFDNAKLREVLEGYSQFSFTGFFDMYVARQEATPVEAILQHQGLCLSQGLSLTYSAGLEFSLNARSATLLVTRVNAQMPAQQAGLTVGDRIVPVPDTRWRSQDSIHLQRVRGGHVQWLKLPTQMLTTPSLFVEPCAQSTVGSK
ncbi:MAG: hypothetical protein FWC40_04210, partial [Proteobacteria bacterium]|nr:hypothetical protein [Pseudomonadota bacterium]